MRVGRDQRTERIVCRHGRAIAAPHIAADFDVPAVAINIAISGYVLTLAVLIPISGWLADRFGARLVVVVGPCSIHDPMAGLEYGRRLKELSAELAESLGHERHGAGGQRLGRSTARGELCRGNRHVPAGQRVAAAIGDGPWTDRRMHRLREAGATADGAVGDPDPMKAIVGSMLEGRKFVP